MFMHVILFLLGVWLLFDDHPFLGVILILVGLGVIP